MKKAGQENVRLEPVMVPHWVRGKESLTMIAPRPYEIPILGLGGSVGTPPEGITAEVLAVRDEADLERLGESARGKIVLFNNDMRVTHPGEKWNYGTAVRYRSIGARLASEKGAVACVIRSAASDSMRTPHTGAMRYGDAKVKIPAAAMSTEDADMITRLCARGVVVKLTLKMEAKTLPDAESANVIGELRGSTWPDEIVVMGGHIDSWDTGQGAHDDGGGCVASMEAINVLRKLNMRPKRTIRVVLWTNEENGLRGGTKYAEVHADELANHVAAIESDSGMFRPTGFGLECKDDERQAVAADGPRRPEPGDAVDQSGAEHRGGEDAAALDQQPIDLGRPAIVDFPFAQFANHVARDFAQGDQIVAPIVHADHGRRQAAKHAFDLCFRHGGVRAQGGQDVGERSAIVIPGHFRESSGL
ncbi:MAG: M20/M25/M40 family metallo-hydrolase [Planctomycetes bacterium]|nr:M20/M25/M40 family metallo-hydrolase [Planctomycetota bacterium]